MIAIFGKAISLLLALFLLVGLGQTGCSFYLANTQPELRLADLVVVFPGSSRRFEAGYKIAGDGLATHLLITNQTCSKLERMAAKNGVPNETGLLSGGKSRSSFEDVFFTARAMQTNSLNSVILVTSTYHLPRSLYLLKTYLAARGIHADVQYRAVEDNYSLGKIIKLYYNEVLKLWGSSSEMAGCFLTDSLILDNQAVSKLRQWFKETFLFKV